MRKVEYQRFLTSIGTVAWHDPGPHGAEFRERMRADVVREFGKAKTVDILDDQGWVLETVRAIRPERRAADVARAYGMIDGAHHKQWVIDQMLRAVLTESEYAEWVAEMNSDTEHDPWDVGVAP